MTLTDLHTQWQDTPDYHSHVHELFSDLVNQDWKLCDHRDFVEKGYGFGERSFWWLWKLLCDEQESGFSFLEIGVYKGATLSLVKLLRPDATVHGVTPLSPEGGYGESDYMNDIKTLHEYFGQDIPAIIHGSSHEKWVIQTVRDMGKWDIVYIDGDHSYEGCLADLTDYSPSVRVGGYLVMDDSNTNLDMPWGYFRGHKEVTEAKLTWLKTQTDFEFVCNVVHISVFRRVK